MHIDHISLNEGEQPATEPHLLILVLLHVKAQLRVKAAEDLWILKEADLLLCENWSIVIV